MRCVREEFTACSGNINTKHVESLMSRATSELLHPSQYNRNLVIEVATYLSEKFNPVFLLKSYYVSKVKRKSLTCKGCACCH